MKIRRTSGPRGNGKKMQRTRMTFLHVLYWLGYLAGMSVDAIPIAQNRHVNVEPRKKMANVAIE